MAKKSHDTTTHHEEPATEKMERTKAVIRYVRNTRTFSKKVEKIVAVNVYADCYRVNVYAERPTDNVVRSLEMIDSLFIKMKV